MGTAATHMHRHVYVPWTTILAVAVAVAIVAAVLYAINRDVATTEAPSVSAVAPLTAAAAVPQPENRAFFANLNDRLAQLDAQPSAAAMAGYAVLHQPAGSAKEGVGAATNSTAPYPYSRFGRTHFRLR